MAKYSVEVKRTVVDYAYVEVEAGSWQEAESIAETMYDAGEVEGFSLDTEELEFCADDPECETDEDL